MESNYKIIGGDGREYGPVTLDELKGWVRDGRVGRQTQVLRSDLGNWMAASQFEELQSEISLLKPTETGVSSYDSVGFWPRVGAFIIDGIFTYFLFWISWAMLAKFMNLPEQAQPANMTSTFKMDDLMPMILYGMKQTMLSLALRMIYEVYMNGRFGATLGKMVVGAKIVRADGSALGYKFAFFRFWARLINEFACHLTYLMVAFREDRRGLHDLIVGTQVIYKR